MLTVADAFAAILNIVRPGPITSIPLEDALGLTLAEPIVSGIDSPPFDKALMDGYAVRATDLAGLERSVDLNVIEEVTAGNLPTLAVKAGEATRIMTGAPIPVGADAVVPIEETSIGTKKDEGSTNRSPETRVTIHVKRPTASGRFILRRGAAVQAGSTVLPAGRILRAQEIAALAELGQARVPVFQRPRVAILATGDELVPVDVVPGPGQIRNSNESMLAAQMRHAGAEPVRLGIARDERSHLRSRILTGLDCDFLLLSGGVSAGKLDLVPSELAAAGVRQVFHKIQMRPGKPLWFGVLDRPGDADSRPCYVFGLPGNPVSSMVCCELFVRAALRKWSGIEPAIASPVSAPLKVDHPMDGNRPTYHPARLDWTSTGPQVTIVDWIGSSDLCATVDANCVALFPAGERLWKAGEILEVFPW